MATRNFERQKHIPRQPDVKNVEAAVIDLARATLVIDIDAGPHRDARRIEARDTDRVVAQVFGIQRIGLVVDAAAINASIPDRDWATYTRERSINGHC